MTTEKSTHATQHEYKRYESPARFLLFDTKGGGALRAPSAPPGTLLLFFFSLFSTCVFILRVNRVRVDVLVTPEEAGETVGTGLMHVNECKQVSDSQINQKIYLILLTVTPPPPHPMHYTIVLNFHILHICYILLFLMSLI